MTPVYEPGVGRGREVPAPKANSTRSEDRLTQDSRGLLEFALREALSLGHNYIAPEHLLLGLVRGRYGAGRLERIVEALGGEDHIRTAVIKELTRRPATCPTCGQARRDAA